MSVEDVKRLDDREISAWDTRDVDGFAALRSDDIVWYDLARKGVRGIVERVLRRPASMTETSSLVTEDALAVQLEFSGANAGPMQMTPAA